MKNNLAGWKGQRLSRPKDLKEILDSYKNEIIEIAIDVDNYEKWYNSEWLAEKVAEIYEDDIPEDTKVEDIEKIVLEWDDDIKQAFLDSLEESPLEEAMRDIRNETITTVRRNYND